MKKILLALSFGFTSIATLSNCSYAQSSAQPVAFNDTKAFKLSVRDMAALESLSTMGTYVPDEKKISTKAIKDFQTRFAAEANNAMWFSDANGFVSYFVKDGYGDRVFYDKKGHWQYSLIFFSEDKLPRDVRAAIKSTYFDMSITLVEEVQTIDAKVYIVHLEDKSNIKILKANDQGEYEILQDLSKG
jgi:hypothetical protein